MNERERCRANVVMARSCLVWQKAVRRSVPMAGSLLGNDGVVLVVEPLAYLSSKVPCDCGVDAEISVLGYSGCPAKERRSDGRPKDRQFLFAPPCGAYIASSLAKMDGRMGGTLEEVCK